MQKKPKPPKRRSRRFYFFVGLFALFALIGIWYSVALLRPTGYAEFLGEYEGILDNAREELDGKRLNWENTVAQNDEASTAETLDQITPSAPKEQPLLFSQAAFKANNMARDLSNLMRKSPYARQVQMRRFSLYFPLDSFHISDDGSRLMPSVEVKSILFEEIKNSNLHYGYRSQNDLAKRRIQANFEQFHVNLNSAEELFRRAPWRMDRYQIYIDQKGLSDLALAVITRAKARNQIEKAQRLLEGFLIVSHQLYPWQFYCNYTIAPPRESVVLFTLHHEGILGGMDLGNSLDLLNNAVLTKERQRNLNVERLINEQKLSRQSLEFYKVTVKSDLPIYQSATRWCFQKVATPLLRSFAVKQSEEYAMARIQGDKDKTEQADARLTRTERVMGYTPLNHASFVSSTADSYLRNNVGPEFSERISDLEDRYRNAVMSLEFYNDEVDFSRLSLACTRYFCAKGDFPETMDALLPDYLPESFEAQGTDAQGRGDRSTWAIYRAPEYDAPVLCRFRLDLHGTFIYEGRPTATIFAQNIIRIPGVPIIEVEQKYYKEYANTMLSLAESDPPEIVQVQVLLPLFPENTYDMMELLR